MFRDTLRAIMLDNALLGLSEHYLDHCDPMFPGQGSGAASPSSPGLDLVLFRVPLRLHKPQ